MTAPAQVPRPKGVLASLLLWCGGVLAFVILTINGYRSLGVVLPVPAGLAVVCGVLAVLIAVRVKWALLLQVLLLLPSLVLFPLTFPAIILLGYSTRPETVAYFDQRTEGPRWDTATAWIKGEGPWLVALAVALLLCAVFGAVLIGMMRALPNL